MLVLLFSDTGWVCIIRQVVPYCKVSLSSFTAAVCCSVNRLESRMLNVELFLNAYSYHKTEWVFLA